MIDVRGHIPIRKYLVTPTSLMPLLHHGHDWKHNCNSQNSQLDKSIDNSPHPGASQSWSTVRTFPDTSLNSLCLWSKCVASSEIDSCCFWKATKCFANNLYYFRNLWDTSDQQVKGKILTVAVGIFPFQPMFSRRNSFHLEGKSN